MADFGFKLYAAVPRASYKSVPALDLDTPSIHCLVSRQSIPQYTTSSVAYVYSSQVPGLPYIAAADLGPVGTTWLVRYEASYGGGSNFGASLIAEINVVSNRIGPPNSSKVYAIGEGAGLITTTPEAARSACIQGWFQFTSDGTDLEFRMSSSSGKPTFYNGLMLIAIPTTIYADQSKLTIGSDYLYSAGLNPTDIIPSVTTNTAPFVTVWNYHEPVMGNGLYLIMACCTGACQDSDGTQMQFKIDGVIQKTFAARIAANSSGRDKHHFCYEGVHSILSGSHDFTIEGGSFAGTGLKTFNRARIVLLRLDKFERVSEVTLPAPVILETNAKYPAWDTTHGLVFGIEPFSDVGEYVLCVGNSFVSRTDIYGGMLSRIYNITDDNAAHEYSCMAQVQTIFPGADGPNFSLSTVSCELLNANTLYRLEHTSQAEQDGSNITVSHRTFVAVGLTKKPAGIPGAVITVSDSCLTSDAAQGGNNSPPIVISDSCGTSDSYIITANNPPSGIPVGRPRLWFYNNDRLARLQYAASNDTAEWLLFINKKATWHWWPYALQYICKPNPTTQGEAIAAANALLAASDGYVFDSSGVFCGELVKEAAIIYDWCYDILSPTIRAGLEDFMLSLVHLQNTQDLICSQITGFGSNAGWGVSSPRNNYHATITKGIVYAAIALYHNQPTTWKWKSNPRYQFNVPSKLGTKHLTNGVYWFDGVSPYFTDCYDLAIYKLDNTTMPIWSDQGGGKGILVGGGWAEGSHYGQRPWRDIPEIFYVLRESGGKDYLLTSTFMRDHINYLLFQTTPHPVPRGGVPVPDIELGDNTFGYVDSGAQMGSSHRASMLMCQEVHKGEAEANYAQWWLQNVITDSYDTGTPTVPGMDLLCYNPALTAVDYRPLINTHWYAQGNGTVAMRNNFTPTGTQITLTANDCREEHADQEQGHILVFKGAGGGQTAWDGYLIGDARTGGGGNYWEVWNNAAYKICDGFNGPNGVMSGRQRFADYNTYPNMTTVTGKINRHYGNAAYSYGQADFSDAYRPIPASVGETSTYYNDPKLIDVGLRDLLYIKPINCFVTYDRIRLLGQYQAGPVQACWPFPRQSPVLQGNGDIMHTLGGNRIFKRNITAADVVSQSIFSFASEGTTTKMDYWRQEQNLAINSGYAKMCTAFQCATNILGGMTATFKIGDAGTDNYEGVTFSATTPRYHVVFSKSQDGSTPALPSYNARKLSGVDVHYVCNLKPDTFYFITENLVSGDVYKYTLGESGIGFLADSGGVVTFIPDDLDDQNTLHILAEDSCLTTDSSATVQHQVITVSDSAITGDSASSSSVSNAFIIAQDYCNTSDSAPVGPSAQAYDICSISESATIVVNNPPGSAPISWTEKVIDVGGVNLVPNEDLFRSFVYGEPDNGSLWDKVSDDDDGSLIFITGGAAQNAQAQFGLTAVSSFVGRVYLIKYVVRVGYCDMLGSSNVKMQLAIGGLGISTLAQTSRNIQLFNVLDAPIEFETEPIPITLTAEEVNRASLVFSLNGSVFHNQFNLRVPKMYVKLLSVKSSEKVIS